MPVAVSPMAVQDLEPARMIALAVWLENETSAGEDRESAERAIDACFASYGSLTPRVFTSWRDMRETGEHIMADEAERAARGLRGAA